MAKTTLLSLEKENSYNTYRGREIRKEFAKHVGKPHADYEAAKTTLEIARKALKHAEANLREARENMKQICHHPMSKQEYDSYVINDDYGSRDHVQMTVDCSLCGKRLASWTEN